MRPWQVEEDKSRLRESSDFNDGERLNAVTEDIRKKNKGERKEGALQEYI